MHHPNIEDITLLEKLNYCSCFTTEANVEDGLPHYICMSCSILIENAYQLKVLCAKTEAKFHELQQLSVVQDDFETEQPSKISNLQIDRIDDSDLNELHEHEEKNRSNKNSKSVKTELGEDIDLIEIEDINSCEQFLSKKVKPKTREAQSKNGDNSKAAYQCEQCCKWFRVKTSLAIHMRSHTNERPYSCEVFFYFHMKSVKS